MAVTRKPMRDVVEHELVNLGRWRGTSTIEHRLRLVCGHVTRQVAHSTDPPVRVECSECPALYPMKKTALISACKSYRWLLGRRWSDGPCVLFVMLNPSTADADCDDPTITRCIGFADAWGFAALEVVNLYAYRSPYPDRLLEVDDPVGPENDATIAEAAARAGDVIAAWGAVNLPAADALKRRHRIARVVELVRTQPMVGAGGRQLVRSRQIKAIEVTKGGDPRHPLYLRGSLRPQPWAP